MIAREIMRLKKKDKIRYKDKKFRENDSYNK